MLRSQYIDVTMHTIHLSLAAVKAVSGDVTNYWAGRRPR